MAPSINTLLRSGPSAEADRVQRLLDFADARMRATADALGLGLWTDGPEGVESGGLEWNDRMYGLYGRDRGEGPAAFDEWLSRSIRWTANGCSLK